MTAETGWAYVGSDQAAGKTIKFYRCTACRAIVRDESRDRHVTAAHKAKR